MSSIASKIEAILYLKAQPLTVAKIAEYANCDREAIEEGLLELMADYAHRDSALEVVETPNGYCLQLRETFHDLIQRLIPVDLGVGALRTLAAIALKGSLSQTKLIELRGSGAYQHVQELVSLGFVRKRRQSDGRSYWLQVTEKFYQYFQVEQLPQPFDQPKGAVALDSEPDSLEMAESGTELIAAESPQPAGPPPVEPLAASGLL
ncbi:MAG: SMC-Scp complex subunit ScpB [Elainella sp.]